jgi:hypothetical protein
MWSIEFLCTRQFSSSPSAPKFGHTVRTTPSKRTNSGLLCGGICHTARTKQSDKMYFGTSYKQLFAQHVCTFTRVLPNHSKASCPRGKSSQRRSGTLEPEETDIEDDDSTTIVDRRDNYCRMECSTTSSRTTMP